MLFLHFTNNIKIIIIIIVIIMLLHNYHVYLNPVPSCSDNFKGWAMVI